MIYFSVVIFGFYGGGVARLFLPLQKILTLTLQKEVVSTHILNTLDEQLVLSVIVSCFLLPKEVAKWKFGSIKLCCSAQTLIYIIL